MRYLSHRLLLEHRISKEDLESLSVSGPAIEVVFSEVESKHRLHRRLNISRFQRDVPKAEGVSAKTIFDVFLGLEKLGAGVIEYENGESFFKWKLGGAAKASSEELVGIISEASALLSQNRSPEDRKRTYESAFKRGPAKISEEVIEGAVHYAFPLRRDQQPIVFDLPTDLTVEEAERLCSFIRSLAVPGNS